MLQYLIILLDDTSTSYCHYENNKTKRQLISIEDLKAGIYYAMKENLMIQFVLIQMIMRTMKSFGMQWKKNEIKMLMVMLFQSKQM